MRPSTALANRVVFKDGQYQTPSPDKMGSDWDKCILAKFAPGTINAKIVAGMNVAPFPTLISATCGSESTADQFGNGSVPIGTDDYLLVAWLPIATCYYGNGDINRNNYPVTTKLGGVCYA